jgi:hypothetical protein
MKTKSTVLYRKLIGDAWSLTWNRKMLWIFGIFAALISTGGVVDVALSAIKKVKTGGSLMHQLFNSSFLGYELFAEYVAQMQSIGSDQAMMMVITMTLIGIGILIMAILSQGSLILGAKSKHTPNPYTLRKQSLKHFWDLFTLAALTKIVTGILSMLMTLPLVLLFIETTQYNAWVFSLLMLVFLPAVVIISIISMFALIDIVENNHGPLHAIEYGFQIFKRQWLATFEFGMLLFFIVFGAGIGLLILTALTAIPYAVLYTLSVLTGIKALFLTVNIFFAVGLLFLLLFFGGATVTFQYTAWYLFYKRAVHKRHGQTYFSKYLRFFRT